MDNRGCLSVISWNCNGLQGKILELREFVQEHAPDLILLQETHLRPGINLRIPNYNIIRDDHINNNSPRPIRGTAICIKNSLNFNPVSLPPLKIAGATGVTLTFPSAIPSLTFVSVYMPIGESASDVIHDLRRLLSCDVNTLVAGDFNAHHTSWNCRNNNTYGTNINNFLLNSNADIIFPDSPTHFTDHSSSTIDFGLFYGFNYAKSITSLSELSSDHNPIKINLQIRIPPPPP